MDFLKLVQKKEHKTDNKIIIATVFLVVLIMSSVVFWPSSPKNNLLTFLPYNTSFYYHFTNKDTFSENFLNQTTAQDKILELENILAGNFLNLQEVIWFQVDGNQDNNYLLRFSRLPNKILEDLGKDASFQLANPQKNILLINFGQKIDLLEADLDRDIYFEEGISIYWKKNSSPEFLKELSSIVEPVFVGDAVLFNWQELSGGKNKISLLENGESTLKDIKNFLVPKEFDLAFGFNSSLSDDMVDNIANRLLKTFFDSLPYYNLNKEVIKNRILTDAMLWQAGDDWILASNSSWQEDILDFVDSFEVKEVPRLLSDGTAYVELVANNNQNIIEHQINGQKVLQIDKLFIWDIGEQHYLSNKRKAIENLSSDNRYLGSILDNCLNKQVLVGDFIYIKDRAVLEQIMADYLPIYDIEDLQMVSYATGTVTGLNICF